MLKPKTLSELEQLRPVARSGLLGLNPSPAWKTTLGGLHEGFRVWGFRAWGLGFRVWGLGV